jgi:hypothetical protein
MRKEAHGMTSFVQQHRALDCMKYHVIDLVDLRSSVGNDTVRALDELGPDVHAQKEEGQMALHRDGYCRSGFVLNVSKDAH